MKTIISNSIIIEDPVEEIVDWCKDNLILDNPEFKQMKIMGKENVIKYRHIPEHLSLFSNIWNKIEIPFGCLYALWPYIKKGTYETKFNNAGNISIQNDDATFELRDYQADAVSEMIKAKGGVLVSPCGSGKGLPLDTKVYTPNGWKRNGDLLVGDKVIGANGKPTTVTNIFDRGTVEAFKITFSDNTEIICDKDHLWNVQSQSQRTDKGRYKTMSTTEIYNFYQNIKTRGKELYIPIVEPVEFEHKNVELSPWLLGILLADGYFGKYEIKITNPEQDIIEKIKEENNEEVKKIKSKNNCEYRLSRKVLKKIKELGLNEKHSYEKFIPENYKYNDIKTRLEVLQGLFDGDGYILNGKNYELGTTSKKMAYDIIEIIQSLGGTAKLSIKQPYFTYNGLKKKGRIFYRIFFKLYKFKPYTSKKHSSKNKERTLYNEAYRIIKKIEKNEPIQSRCITVSAEDQLYVIENFLVTHNTICGINIIKRIGKKALWLCHTTDLLTQTKTAMLEQFPNIKIGLTTNGKLDIGEDVTISTVQTLVNIDPILYKDKFDTVIVDECAHVSGTPTKLKMFSKVLSSIPARYKFGLTATPSREDGLINSMYAYIGCNMDGEFSPTFKVDKSCVKTITAEHIMIPIDNGYNDFNSYELYDTSGMINYTNLINVLSDNTDRTLKIVDNIVKCYKEGRKQVVLSSRKSHCEEFERLLKEKGIKVYYIASKLSAKKREEIIKQKVEWDVIIATYSLLKEGVDIKELDTLHMTMPTKAKDAVVQCAGRIERYMENKKQPIVYDYVDEDIPYCVRTYKKRKGQLKRRY